MQFKFIVNKQPLQLEYETDTLEEGIAILRDKATVIGQAFEDFSLQAAADGEGAPAKGRRGGRKAASTTEPPAPAPAAPVAAAAAPQPPAPAPAAAPAPQPPAPVVAQAPAPIPPPGAPTPAQAGNVGHPDLTLPSYLDQSQRQPAPPQPPAPPVAPPAPVVRLSAKVIDELKRRASASADGGRAFADWLAQSSIVTQGSSFDESLAVLEFMSDEQLTGIAQALDIA